MSRRTYWVWLTAWILSVVVYGAILIVANWRAPAWLNVPVTLIGLVSLGQCLRWYWQRHREYVSAKCSARAAADHARRN